MSWIPTKKCVVCGKLMPHARRDKKTCSPACRKRLSRASSDEVSHFTAPKRDTKAAQSVTPSSGSAAPLYQSVTPSSGSAAPLYQSVTPSSGSAAEFVRELCAFCGKNQTEGRYSVLCQECRVRSEVVAWGFGAYRVPPATTPIKWLRVTP